MQYSLFFVKETLIYSKQKESILPKLLILLYFMVRHSTGEGAVFGISSAGLASGRKICLLLSVGFLNGTLIRCRGIKVFHSTFFVLFGLFAQVFDVGGNSPECVSLGTVIITSIVIIILPEGCGFCTNPFSCPMIPDPEIAESHCADGCMIYI